MTPAMEALFTNRFAAPPSRRGSWRGRLGLFAALLALGTFGMGAHLAAAADAPKATHAAVHEAETPVHETADSAATSQAAETELGVALGETASHAAGHEAAHGAGQGDAAHEEHGAPEIPHGIQLLYEYFHEKAIHEGTDPKAGAAGVFAKLHKGAISKEQELPIVGTVPWENNVYALIAAVVLVLIFWLGVRRLNVRKPSRWQSLVESIVEGFDKFICGILGQKQGRRYAPYIMTLFLFILVNNLMGIVPFMKSASSSLVLTASLALLTFVIVQATAMVNLGPWGVIFHLLGSPKSAIEWCMSPLFFVLHVIGELAKPVSLALRLFGNILGEDILLGAFLGMGLMLTAALGGGHLPTWSPGVPLHFPFLFLVLLTSTIQALVFSLLTTIYILLVLPHDEHHDEASHEAGAGDHHEAGHKASPGTAVPGEASAA